MKVVARISAHGYKKYEEYDLDDTTIETFNKSYPNGLVPIQPSKSNKKDVKKPKKNKMVERTGKVQTK